MNIDVHSPLPPSSLLGVYIAMYVVRIKVKCHLHTPHKQQNGETSLLVHTVVNHFTPMASSAVWTTHVRCISASVVLAPLSGRRLETLVSELTITRATLDLIKACTHRHPGTYIFIQKPIYCENDSAGYRSVHLLVLDEFTKRSPTLTCIALQICM